MATNRDILIAKKDSLLSAFLERFPQGLRRFVRRQAIRRSNKITYDPQDPNLGTQAQERRRRQISKGMLKEENGLSVSR